MNFVPYAIPVFLLMIVLELGYGLLKGNNTYRVNDSINSLSMGLLSTVTKFVFLNIGALVFAQISREYAIWSFDINSLGHWLLAILLYDFLYYWFHRISHERQFFWGSHVVHHQSEDYNLSTALRQTSTSFATTWVFYIPCFFLGMPISMFVSIASAHLIYQFWVHTQHIPKLGIFEWFMVSPSNHRVHHAQNADYIDKNYGGLLIIWDRLFGTFKAEEENQQAIYGIRVPLRSWNPIWANLHIFAAMLRDIWHTQRWSDKFRVLWSKTGWHPEDMVERFPEKKSDLQQFEKYNPQHSSLGEWRYYFAIPVACGITLLERRTKHPALFSADVGSGAGTGGNTACDWCAAGWKSLCRIVGIRSPASLIGNAVDQLFSRVNQFRLVGLGCWLFNHQWCFDGGLCHQ